MVAGLTAIHSIWILRSAGMTEFAEQLRLILEVKPALHLFSPYCIMCILPIQAIFCDKRQRHRIFV